VSAPTVDQQVSLASAVRQYLRASERYEQATHEFNKACSDIRAHDLREVRLVVQANYRHWLLEINAQGDFEVEQIQLI